MKKLQIGDLVKVNGGIREYFYAEDLHMNEGEVLKIESIIKDTKLRLIGESNKELYISCETGYKLENGRIYFERWLDLVKKAENKDNEKSLKLSDLKDGQLIEIRSGQTFIKFGKMLVKVSDAEFLPLSEYNENLNYREGHEGKQKYDIVEVYNSNNAEFISSIHGEKSLAAKLMPKEIRREELEKVWSR